MNRGNSAGVVGHRIQRFVIALSAWYHRQTVSRHPLSQKFWRKAYFLYKERFEDPFATLVLKNPELFRTGHILDVGANRGYTSVVFTRAIRSGFQVYAFEPEATHFEQLALLAKEPALASAVVPVQAAVGEHSGTASLWVNPSDSSDHRMVTSHFHGLSIPGSVTREVSVLSLDDFVDSLPKPHPIAFIKLDIQGYEGPALRGMIQVLADNPHAAVAVEYCRPIIESLGFRAEEILDFFLARGYRVFHLTRLGGAQPIAPAQIDSEARNRGYLDLLFLPRGATRPADSIRL